LAAAGAADFVLARALVMRQEFDLICPAMGAIYRRTTGVPLTSTVPSAFPGVTGEFSLRLCAFALKFLNTFRDAYPAGWIHHPFHRAGAASKIHPAGRPVHSQAGRLRYVACGSSR